MNPKLVALLLILIAVIIESVADILLKKWSIQNKNILLIIGLGIYFIGTLFWAFSLKYDYLSKAISMFTILNLIIIILVGVLFFKENISLINKVGIGLGIISVILMEI